MRRRRWLTRRFGPSGSSSCSPGLRLARVSGLADGGGGEVGGGALSSKADGVSMQALSVSR